MTSTAIDHDSIRGAIVYGSKELYSMALYALIDNAGKYQRLESGDIRIFAKHDHKSNDVLIFIENDGIEIQEEEANKIFTCDYRGNKAKELNIDGSGIGLWLCAEILKRNTGEITLESRSEPVRFKIKLPRGR